MQAKDMDTYFFNIFVFNQRPDRKSFFKRL